MEKLTDNKWGIKPLSVERRKEIANTIYKQLGGGKFSAMTGAKNFVFTESGLQFKIGRNSKGINFVKIDYNAKDLYDVEFGKVRSTNYKTIKKFSDVYNDQLVSIFEETTGLYTHL